MPSRIIKLMLAIAVIPSACVVGRIGRAWEHVGSAGQARMIASRIDLPGRVVEEVSFGRCAVAHGKWHDSYSCRSYVARFAVVPMMGRAAWPQLQEQFQEQLIPDGWNHLGPGIFKRADFEVWIFGGPQIPPIVRRTRYEKRVDSLMNDLTSNELLLGLFVAFQTPTDVLRSNDCYPILSCLPFL